jgi:hypothetical protein
MDETYAVVCFGGKHYCYWQLINTEILGISTVSDILGVAVPHVDSLKVTHDQAPTRKESRLSGRRNLRGLSAIQVFFLENLF